MQAASSALDDGGVLILQTSRPSGHGAVAAVPSGGVGGAAGGGRSRRSQSVTAESIRAQGTHRLSQLQTQSPATIFLLPGAAVAVDAAIIGETDGASATPRPPASARSPRPQPQQRRRSSVVCTQAVAASQHPQHHREFAPPATAEQLLRAIQSAEVFEAQDEWTMVARPNGATFWLSRRTGQFKPHAPNSVYRSQALEMRQLQHRIRQLEGELNSTRIHLGNRNMNQKQSEDQRPDMEEKDAQLLRLGHSLEKLKTELGQKDELVKLKEAELTRRSKEIQKLGEKVQRVDALMAELLEAQECKNQLEQQVREKDFELGQMRRQLQIAVDEKSAAIAAERATRERCENLKEYARTEIERTASLEERLESLEKAAEDRVRLEAEVNRLVAAARDADALAASSRRVQRRLSDQLAAVRTELAELRAAHGSALAAAEVRELELTEARAAGDQHRRAAVGLRSTLEELRRQIPEAGAWIDAYLENSGSGRCDGGVLLHRRPSGRLLNGRPSSSAAQMPPASQASANKESENSLDRRELVEDADGFIDVAKESVTASKLETSSRSDNGKTTGSVSVDGSTTSDGVGSRVSRQLRDRVAALYIHLGDRVTVRLAGGRTSEAVVKYIGPGSQPPAGAGGRERRSGGTRYGLKLLGREAAAPAAPKVAEFRSSDLLVPAKRIDCVCNQKTNAFRKLDELVSDYLSMSIRS